MANAHYIRPTGNLEDVTTVRLGAGSGTANQVTEAENNKFVKLVATDRFDLAAAGDDIEGVLLAVEAGTSGGFSVGGVCLEEDFLEVTADGLQATPGTGVIAAGDYVVVGTVVAKGTKLTGLPRVTKATNQATAKASPFARRVVSLGSAGTGAVGTIITIQKV